MKTASKQADLGIYDEQMASQRQREPVSIACEMARRELGLPEQETETLRGYHQDGNKLLKRDRSQGE
jgi:hypothetical protein